MSILKAFLLNLQFFTIIPIHSRLTVGKRELVWMVRIFPLLGVFLGLLLAGGYAVLDTYTGLSTLATAFFVWVVPIILTGAIHLDGFMDACDGYFSYREKEKRLTIMKDPRVGAFGVMSILILLSSRFLFIYESVLTAPPNILMATLILIPFFSRVVMGAGTIFIPPAQKSGMGYEFSKNLSTLDIVWIGSFGLAVGIVMWIWGSLYLFWVFAFVTGVFFLFIYSKTIKWFGGMTGDTTGASVEGVEWILWMTIWLLCSSGML
ncbi:adenosylcobinamide-GDP ribazoletransferase [Bacillus sp. KH172YL63]|uniref:adenosylcobinamide-GDP ribazoletransferase n=1 Tax=Bacillus sp. KH172YL63 TaxID=2709784 RepID=UPI0013E48042|nr:adenosylcobinamide-GDP ribazoletransferase [Bacillus sp. KH172YL63]BCB03894.1 adenosylcobinamide-GDP ribazoletransferase [Bacillus sp. KH172YL63]